MSSEDGETGESVDTPTSTDAARLRLLLGFDSPPEHRSQHMRLRAEWAKEMISSWQMGDAIQLMNEIAMKELLLADPGDSAALLRAKVKLEVVSEFQVTMEQMVNEWEQVEAIRERVEARRRGEDVQ